MTRKSRTIAFWRGNLPHWEVEEGRYFVTIHLTGAIPKEGVDRIRGLAAKNQNDAPETENWLKLQRRIYAAMEAWLDRSDFATILQLPNMAEIVAEAIEFRNGREWNVLEFVIMPSHLHLFFEMRQIGLKHSLEQFKRWTGHRAAKLLSGNGERFWQDEWFDHWSRSDEEDEKIIVYMRRNPEKAKLVSDYRDWPYGSWNRRPGIAPK
jgi:REP element-mobilizing transposase RayT